MSAAPTPSWGRSVRSFLQLLFLEFLIVPRLPLLLRPHNGVGASPRSLPVAFELSLDNEDEGGKIASPVGRDVNYFDQKLNRKERIFLLDWNILNLSAEWPNGPLGA